VQIIPIANLSLILLPALLVVWILWRWTRNAKSPLYALARMVLQLIAIGYILTTIFETKHATLVLGILTIMLAVSSWIALRSVPDLRKQLYWHALFATVIVNGSLLILITQIVLAPTPWFAPNILIPLAGMVFAVGMNAISLFAERYYSEMNEHGADQISARNTAFKATLIPITNSLLAVGLVSLPGMMTGQILSGVSPLIAVRYQIMVMLMLFSATGLTAALFYQLIRNR